MHNLLSCVFLLIYITAGTLSAQLGNVQFLEPESTVAFIPKPGSRSYNPALKIFCYDGKPKYLMHMFHTIILNLECDHEDFTQYEGGTPEIVMEHREAQKSIFSFNFLSNNKKKIMKLDPFNQTCIGIASNSPYTVKMTLIRIDFYKVILLVVGIFIFLTASKLSENSLFYYLCGICFGIFASFLVVVWFASKLFPKRPMMYGVMFGGWTLGIYFAQMLIDNIRVIFVTYQAYVFWYVLITGFVSFIICYRIGPPKNQRSKNLIKWSLQFAALICMFFSSNFQEASVGVGIATALFYYFPRTWISNTKAYWRRRFPARRRLLTTEEFYEEGVRETTKALDELRDYCSSPNCKQWKTVLVLKDPQRFASFMEGSSHIADDEILDYETSNANVFLSEDDSDEEELIVDDDDEEVVVTTPQEGRKNGHVMVANSSKLSNSRVFGRNPSTSTPVTRSGSHISRRNIVAKNDLDAEISDDE